MATKSPLTKSLLHSLEVGVVCLVVLGVVWLMSLLQIVETSMVKDAILPLILATLGSLAPKYMRTDGGIDDYVNK